MKGVSIIIPALNEEKYIEKGLEHCSQTKIPHEIIVADAGSTDNTQKLAEQYGAKVVEGGLPGVGRNAGAKVATYDTLLFLDADTFFETDDLEKAYDEFINKNVGIATCYSRPSDGKKTDQAIYQTFNYVMFMNFQYKPQFPGFCMFVKREVHENIGGFDETITYFEDAEYTERAAKAGKARILKSAYVYTSARRLHATSRFKVAKQVVGCWLHRLLKKEARDNKFNYEFDIYE